MRKAQVILGVALVALVSTSAFAAVSTDGVVGDANVSLVYYPETGQVELDAAGGMVSTFEVVSASGTVFTGTRPAALSSPFDVYTPAKLFTLQTAGIGDTDFGVAAAAGLSKDFLGGDISITGSMLPSGGLAGGGDIAYMAAVPEPSSIALILMGLLGMLKIRR